MALVVFACKTQNENAGPLECEWTAWKFWLRGTST